MAPKRPFDGASGPSNGTQRKKQRMEAARTINVQPVASSSKVPSAEMAKSVRFNSMEGLPSSIDVEKFVESRSFEITAMQEAMTNASANSTHRVWQTLPRHMRRRAASHDVRRVPVRLRGKARAEMDPPSKTASRKRISKRGKGKVVSRTEDLLRRQHDKTWLETHIWHAKRMHMANMWGYRLAVEPTEKSFRPSHRASIHGSILHDCSYEAIIELSGPEATLKSIFDTCCDPQEPSPGAVRFLSGSRVCLAHLYKIGTYPFELISPIEVLWRPNISPSDTAVSSAKKPGEENPKQNSSKSHKRTVWIRCHPLSFEEVCSTVRLAISKVLQDVKDKGENPVEVELTDLRDCFNIFEIIGPKSSQIITGALKPIKDELVGELRQVWANIGQLRTTGTVPRGMVIGFTVYDPRLHYPPKNTAIIEGDNASQTLNLWPAAAIANCDLWEEGKRNKLQKPRYKKKDIDGRKSKNLVPGTKLNPLRQDDRIPVLLIQRSLTSLSAASEEAKDSASRSLFGWTLIIPKGWGMSFFSSLTHTGTRVGGQRERATQHFEASSLYFPRDFPCTPGYEAFVSGRAKEDRERWERKPPAKRPSWDKLGTRSPWQPDWEVVLGLRAPATEENLVSAQREVEDGIVKCDISPWVLRGPNIPELVTRMTHMPNPSSLLLPKVNELRAKRGAPAIVMDSDMFAKTALLMVKLSFPCSGAPDDDAIIYDMADEEAGLWRNMMNEVADSCSETELSELPVQVSSIIGYITSGHYSLSIGRAQAIGAISLLKFLGCIEQSYRLARGSSRPLVKVRNKDGTICRVAELEILC